MRALIAATAISIAAAMPAWAVVDIVEVETPAGFKAWLVEEPSIPFVALEIRFRGGTSLDAADKLGATNLMTGLLEEGAGDLDAQSFIKARDSLASSFSFSTYDDVVSVSARFLTENTDASVALLKSALTEPRFDAEAVERVRSQVMIGLRSNAEDPDEIATDTFAHLTYGEHPYGRSGEGTLDTVSALTQEDLHAAHQGALARDRVYIGAAGDISPAELAEVIDALLADLPETGAPLPKEAPFLLEGGVNVVNFDTPQSVIQFAQPGIARDDPDFFPAFVMNEVLGGSGLGSRLMTEVREKRGLTYGIYAYLIQKDHSDLFVGRVATSNAQVSETIEVVRDVWTDVAENGITEDELERAKTYLTGAYPLRFDGNASIANILVGMQMDDMPIDYISTRNGMIEAVTLGDVKRVSADLLNPEALGFVVVGQPEGIPASN